MNYGGDKSDDGKRDSVVGFEDGHPSLDYFAKDGTTKEKPDEDEELPTESPPWFFPFTKNWIQNFLTDQEQSVVGFEDGHPSLDYFAKDGTTKEKPDEDEELPTESPPWFFPFTKNWIQNFLTDQEQSVVGFGDGHTSLERPVVCYRSPCFAKYGTTKLGHCDRESGTPAVEFCYQGAGYVLSQVCRFSRNPQKGPRKGRKLKIRHNAVLDKNSKWDISVLARAEHGQEDDPGSQWKDITDVYPRAKYTILSSEVEVKIPNGSVSDETILMVVGEPNPGAKKRSQAYVFVESKGPDTFIAEIYPDEIPANKNPSAALRHELQFPARGPHDVKLMGIKTMDEGVTWKTNPINEMLEEHEASAEVVNIPQPIIIEGCVDPEPTGNNRASVKLELELLCGGDSVFLPITLDMKKEKPDEDEELLTESPPWFALPHPLRDSARCFRDKILPYKQDLREDTLDVEWELERIFGRYFGELKELIQNVDTYGDERELERIFGCFQEELKALMVDPEPGEKDASSMTCSGAGIH